MRKTLLLLLLAACASETEVIPTTGEASTTEPAVVEPEIPLWAPGGDADEIDADEGPDSMAEPLADPGPKVRFSAPRRLAPWNSEAGRAEAQVAMGTEPAIAVLALPQLQSRKTACVTPEFMTGSSSGQYPDGGPRLKSPASAFETEADARAFLETVYAAMPFVLPYTHPDVHLGHGWIYNGGGSHRGQDYSRSGVPAGDDPTFLVRAVAPGKVLYVYWSNGGGNTVVVQHTAPNGRRYLSSYLHLRNGKDHDLAIARGLDCSASSDGRCPKYKKFAEEHGDHVSWGTNAHVVLVKPGDDVTYQQPLAWAGNTGPGGAGNGLDDDGNPKSPRGNVHLHGYFSVELEPASSTYVVVDPFGVYNKQSTGCYDLLEDTEFDRLFAPFYDSFHDLPIEVLSTYFSYYTKMGRSLRTLSVFRTLGGTRVAGSFQSGIAGTWYARMNYSAAEFQEWFDKYLAMGLVPRETSVSKTATGALRYSAIFRPLRAGEHFEHWGALSDDAWSAKWQQRVVGEGWRVESYFGFMDGTHERRAALFTSDTPRPFYLHRDRPASEIAGIINGNFANGLAPVDLNVVEHVTGDRFTAILRPEPGTWRWQVGMTSAEYQSLFATMTAQGFHLHKIQGYQNGNRYLAVFRK